MEQFEKAKKNLKNDMIVLFIIELILGILGLNIINIILSIVLIVGYNNACKGTKIAGNIGIVVGIFMMLLIITRFEAIIDFMLGLFVLMHSIKYNKSYIAS